MSINTKTQKQLILATCGVCAVCENVFKKRENQYAPFEFCHIKGKKPGSARYDPNMTDEQRDDEKNLIALCPSCHKLIDHEVKHYTAEKLKKIKEEHLKKMTEKLVKEQPSFLMKILKELNNDLELKKYKKNILNTAFKIEEKIKYNNVVRFRAILESNKIYHYKLEALYEEIEKENPLKWEQFPNYIKNLYLEAKGLVLNNDFSIENIQKKADDLIEKVKELLENKIKNRFSEELIYLGLNIIVVDMFMRCKILEEPK